MLSSVRLSFFASLLLCIAATAQDALPQDAPPQDAPHEPQVTVTLLHWEGVIIVPERPRPLQDAVPAPPGDPYNPFVPNHAFVRETAPPLPPTVRRLLPRPPGTVRMTNEDIEPWLHAVARDYPQVTQLRRLAQSAQGRFVWALEVRPQNVSADTLRRLAVVCRQHGNEPETTAAAVELIYQLLHRDTPRTGRHLRRVALFIIPVANPDGAWSHRRSNALGQNLNRDWGRGHTREVSAIMYELQRWQPHLVVDVHQWVPGDACQTPMAEVTGDHFARKAGALMAGAARQNGYRLAYRAHGGGGTLCHRHYGRQRGVPAILLETVHRPHSPRHRQIAIQTSVVALQRVLDLLAQ